MQSSDIQSYPIELNLPLPPVKQYIAGDTFPDLKFKVKDKTTLEPLPLDNAIIRMDWRNKDGVLVRQFTSLNGSIEIIQPGEFIVKKFRNNTQPGNHDYDLQIEIEGDNLTYFKGKVRIGDQITK
ncbi:MAG: hypothetical protein O9346_01895 [Leptospiraceae bacterium]|jgi:hypothetical protein|nr:hypothetical protein [Leptospiraceae bacterium]